MGASIDVSDIVNFTVVVSPTAIPYSNFGLPCIAGASSVIDVNQRVRSYSTLTGVAQDFGTSAPEYLAAVPYFSQTPQPNQLLIGRFAQTATAGLLHGATLTASQQILTNFTAITTGAFNITIDGVPKSISGLNLSTALNLNGVASLIQTALQAQFASSTVTWGGTYYPRFDIKSGTTGAASSVSFGSVPTALNSASFAGQPAVNDTLAINGTTVTFVASGATGNQVNIGGTLAATLVNLLTFLSASVDVNLVKTTYSVTGTVLYMTSVVTGTAGNAYTLAKVSTNITIGGATFSGGSGADVSALLALTSASGASPLVPGIAAETALACTQALATASSQWYFLTFAATLSISDHIAVGGYILASSRTRRYGVTITTTDCLDPTQTSDLASLIQAANNKRMFWQYSSSNPYAVMSFIGRAATVNFNAQNATITLAFKQEPGITAEGLNETQMATMRAKGGNAFLNVDNGASIIWPGQNSDASFFDEVHGYDWFQNRLTTDAFNLLYQSGTKIPQTDDGAHQVLATLATSCDAAVYNGYAAPGQWNAGGFGQLVPGMVLPLGYYIYCAPMATQSQALRETRVMPPVQIALKLAGAIQGISGTLNINR